VTNVEAGHYFLGWTTSGPCAPPSSPTLSRTDCSVFLNTEQSVEANLGDTQDGTAPTASTVSKGVVKRYSIQIKWTPSIDETWLGGYEILRNGIPYARRGPAATAFTATSLLCNTKYRWRVRAFDSVHLIDSNSIIVKTGACAKVPPNTVLHVKPPGVTRSRTAYFHWGAVRRGVDLIRFKSQCRLGRYGVWRKCFPGKTYRNLKPGYHTVRIRTGDSQGWDRTPVKYRWLVRR